MSWQHGQHCLSGFIEYNVWSGKWWNGRKYPVNHYGNIFEWHE